MNKINIYKVKQREKTSNSLYSRDLDDYSEIRLWNESNSIFFEKNTMDKIHNWKGLNENSNVAFNDALDTFNELLENSLSICRIQSTCNYLIDEMVLVNNSLQLKKNIKNKLAYMKRKNKANIHNKMMKRNILSGSTLQRNMNSKLPRDSGGREFKRESLIEECYNKLYQEAKNIYECDRIIANYNRISKRFKLENLIDKFKLGNTNLYSTIQEIASLIDTFEAPFRNIYNSTLETCWYLFNKKYVNFTNTDIIEAGTDYFILNDGLLDSEINDIKIVSESSAVMDKDDFKCINYLFETDNSKDIKVTDGKPDNKISIELKKDYKPKETHGNHQEPFSYTVFDKPKSTEGGIPNFDDYGVGGKETEDKKYPLYAKLKECAIENSKKFNPYIVTDYINNYKYKMAMNYDINNNYNIKVKEYINTLSAIANNVNGDILLKNLSYILSFTSANFILVNDEESSSIIDILSEICKKIISSNEKNINTVIDILDEEYRYLIKHSEYSVDSHYNHYYTNYINKFEKIIKYFKEYRILYIKDISVNDNIDTIKETAGIITIERLLRSIIESLDGNNPSTYIANNIEKFNENLNSIVNYVNDNTNIINRSIIKEALISYKNNLRKNESTINFIKINNINESIDSLSQASPYKINKSINSTIDSLVQLETMLDEIKNTEYSAVPEIRKMHSQYDPYSKDNKSGLSYIDYELVGGALCDIHYGMSHDYTPTEEFVATCINSAMVNIFYICLSNINSWTKPILKSVVKWYAEFYSNKLRTVEQREYALRSLNSVFDLIVRRYSELNNNDPETGKFYDELNYCIKMARDRIHYRYREDLENGILPHDTDPDD